MMGFFKHEPCLKCKTTNPGKFKSKEKNFCRDCLKQMKFSPQNQDYFKGLVTQKLNNLYWPSPPDNEIKYGLPFAEMEKT